MTRPSLAAPVLLAALAAGAASAATPIANGPPTSLPAYVGAPAVPRRIRAPRPPRNPWQARNGRSNLHNDPWQTDAYWRRGPLGRAPVLTSANIGRDCITITFDRRGRLIASCSNLTGARLFLFDPVTLDTLAELALPFVPVPPGQDPTTNSTGGSYFYLDRHDRAVIATAHGHLWIVRATTPPSPPAFALVQDWDLTAALNGDRLTSAFADWEGRYWFVGRYDGVVGVLDPRTGTVAAITLGEEIQNSFAVDRDGVYIVSDARMYRFGLDGTGVPAIVWADTYQNTGVAKVGMFNAGSGTTPTLLRGGWVAIADNADPINVVVYRTDAVLPAGASRVVCEVPVFEAGASATENSLVGVGRSLVVENNSGYHAFSTINGAVTAPGITRIDVDADGGGCHAVWHNATERAASVVPKASVRNGLVYVYTKDPDPVNTTADAWYWTALDFATGALVWKQLAGTGFAFNNHYAGIVLGRDGTAYVGVLAGLVSLRDGF